MSSMRVLIVDDSKTAQHRLKRLLNNYDLDVDLAQSAEQALGYLSHSSPVVIFMDHHMEGMDGLEALKIIKANPSTAMIPVIMYTSQSGDVYVGRAHALGALDILSKEVIQPANLETVLNKLKIYPQHSTAANEKATTTTPAEAAVEAAIETTVEAPIEAPAEVTATEDDLTANTDSQHADQEAVSPQPQTTDQQPHSGAVDSNDLRAQVAKLFELHIADVRMQITENTKFMVRRLSSEMRSALDDIKPEEKEDDFIDPEPTTNSSLLTNILLAAAVVLLLAITIKVFRQPPHQTDNNILAVELSELREDIEDIQNANGTENIVTNGHSGPETSELLDALSLASDLRLTYPFGRPPMNIEQMANFQQLVDKLDMAGFRGSIELTIFTGNYCVKAASDGRWILADDATLASTCTFSHDINQAEQEAWASELYVNLENLSEPIRNGIITLTVHSGEPDERDTDYPEQLSAMTADKWNHIAAKYNRIGLRFEQAE